MIDLHAHILPGIDDGPSDIDESLALCAALVADGISRATATSHLPNAGDWGADAFFEEAERLVAVLRAEAIPLDVTVSAEFSMAYVLDADPDVLHELAIGGRYVLVEPPLNDDWGAIAFASQRLAGNGLYMLLAHAERFPPLHRSSEGLIPLVRGGVLVQVTAPALAGSAPKPQQRAARRLLQEGLVHCISTDAHGATRRPPQLRDAFAAVRRAHGETEAEWLTLYSPERILRGEPIVPAAGSASLVDSPRPAGWRKLLSRRSM